MSLYINIRCNFQKIRKLAKPLAFLFTLVALSPHALSQNLVTNPGFENGTDGWTLELEPDAQFTQSDGRSGDRLTHWSDASSYKADARQTVSGLSGGTYRLSLYTVGGETAGAWLWAYCDGQSYTTTIPSSPWGSWAQVAVDNIQVSGGSCTVGITTEDSEWSSFDDVVFERVSGGDPSELVIEEGTGFCDVDGSVDSDWSGYNGSGFANTDNATGNGVDWTVNVPSSGNYTLEWRYANGGSANRSGDVLINGSSQAVVDFAATGGWESWTSASAEIALSAGENTIRLEATTSSGLGNIDSITVTGSSPQAVNCGSTGGGATIYNDTWWKDTSNNPIFSQGGGVLKVGGTYYWYGVEYTGAQLYYDNPGAGKRNNDVVFASVNTYSSQDLVNWTLEAKDVLENPGGWFGRLGVAYNENTNKYVLISQTWNPTDGNAMYFATSDSPAGGFEFSNIQNNLSGVVNGATGDQTIFIDDDGKAYVVASSLNGRSNRYIIPLRESDYLRVEDPIFVYKGDGREGNTMFKHEGIYYFCSSDLHGWNTSQTYCVTSQSIYGPWSSEFVMKGSEKDYSHVTQAGFFIKVNGTEKTTIIYAGDRWADFAGNGIGYNQWVPISFNGTEPYFNSLSAWTLNATTGNWSVAPENNYVLNPSFEADRIKVGQPRGWYASNAWPSDQVEGHTGKWSWDISGSGWMYHNIDSLPNGTYDLAVWVSRSSGGELYVKNHGGSEMRMDIPSSSGWTRVRLRNIQVTAGTAEIGVRANGASLRVDDFTMILSGYDQP